MSYSYWVYRLELLRADGSALLLREAPDTRLPKPGDNSCWRAVATCDPMYASWNRTGLQLRDELLSMMFSPDEVPLPPSELN